MVGIRTDYVCSECYREYENCICPTYAELKSKVEKLQGILDVIVNAYPQLEDLIATEMK